MLVKELIIENFKGTGKRVIDLDPDCTLITGNKRVGKTTIGEAIPFALYGVTLDGSPRCDSLIMQGAKKAAVTLTVQVDGTNHTIKRTKTRRGTEVTLDAKEATQADIDGLVGFTVKEYMAMYNSSSVLKMEPTKARALFISLIEPPARENVLNELYPGHRELLMKSSYSQNPDLALEQCRKDLKTAEEKTAALSGAMSEVNNQIVVAKEKLLSFTKPDDREIARLKEKIERFQIPAEPQKPDGSGLKILQSKVTAAREEYKSLFEQKLRLLQQYPPKPSDKCPTCGQNVPVGMMAGVQRKWEEQTEKVNRLVSEVNQKMTAVAEKGKELAGQLETERKAHQIKGGLYKTTLEKWKSSTETARDTLRAHTEQLRKLQEKQTNYSGLVNRKESLEKRLAEIEQENEDCQKEIKKLKQEIEAINEYRFKAVELQMKQLKPHLAQVDVKLFEIVKSTGEIKPAFIITFDGRPVNMFSRSEETMAGLEIALLVQKLKGANVPVFVDNTESAPGLELPEGPQYVLVKVVPGQELRVHPAGANVPVFMDNTESAPELELPESPQYILIKIVPEVESALMSKWRVA